MPEVFRSAVILRDLEGMSYDEVAEVLSVIGGHGEIAHSARAANAAGNSGAGAAATRMARMRPRRPGRIDQRESVLHSALFSGCGGSKSRPDRHNRLGASGQDG